MDIERERGEVRTEERGRLWKGVGRGRSAPLNFEDFFCVFLKVMTFLKILGNVQTEMHRQKVNPPPSRRVHCGNRTDNSSYLIIFILIF